jgi:hypothetical protein
MTDRPLIGARQRSSDPNRLERAIIRDSHAELTPIARSESKQY